MHPIAAAFIIIASLAISTKTTACTTTAKPVVVSTSSMTNEVKDLLSKAQQGDAVAQNKLGLCYLKGDGVNRNDSLAVKWLSKSAMQKYPNALVNLAYCVRHGYGVKADSIAARDLYINAIGLGKDSILNILTAASGNDVFISRTLAYAYENGKGVKRNLINAKGYLKQALDKGDKDSYFPYAMLCLKTRDHVSAQSAFKKAYELGNKTAGYWYGRYLINGEGNNPNPQMGYNLVYPFALEGQTGAMELVGKCLLTGNGTTANEAEAVKWLTKAANNGSVEALWQTALCYASGTGVETNMLMAFSLMRREAMHTSENKFKTWLDPVKGSSNQYPVYVLFIQGLKAINEADFTAAQKISKELKKAKSEKESRLIEGFILLSSNNEKRNIKKGYKLLQPYLENDPILLYLIDKMQINNELAGLDESSMRDVVKDLEQLGDNGLGMAYTTLGDMYLHGEHGLTQSDQRAISYWLKAQALDGLSYESAQTLAQCYEEGLGGLQKDADKARKLRNNHNSDPLQTLYNLIPDWK